MRYDAFIDFCTVHYRVTAFLAVGEAGFPDANLGRRRWEMAGAETSGLMSQSLWFIAPTSTRTCFGPVVRQHQPCCVRSFKLIQGVIIALANTTLQCALSA